jgi:hypothetical protein
MQSVSQRRVLIFSLRRFFASKVPPKISDLFGNRPKSDSADLFGAAKFNPLPKTTFDDLRHFKSQKDQLYKLIKSSIRSNEFIHDIEVLMQRCKENHDNYLAIIDILRADEKLFDEIPYNFHKTVINYLLKRNTQMTIVDWSRIFHLLRRYYKTKQEVSTVSDLFNKSENELVRNAKHPDVIFTLSCKFPNRFLDIIAELNFDGLSEKDIWNILGHVVHSADDVTIPKFLETVLKFNFAEKINEVEYFIDNIDIFLFARTRANDKDLANKHPELAAQLDKLDQETKLQTLKVFRFGNLREIKQLLTKMDEFADYFGKFGQEFIGSCFQLINYDRMLAVTQSNFDKFLFSVAYGHFGFKYGLSIQREKVLETIEQMLTECAVDEKFAERISDKQFEQLIKFLFNVNQRFVYAPKSEMMTEGLNRAVADILDFKIPKIVAKGQINTILTIKLYMFLKVNFEHFETFDRKIADTYLMNIKRMEFILAEKLVYWTYEPQIAVYLKKILVFLYNKKIGSVKFKELLSMALDNVDKERRRDVYEAYK